MSLRGYLTSVTARRWQHTTFAYTSIGIAPTKDNITRSTLSQDKWRCRPTAIALQWQIPESQFILEQTYTGLLLGNISQIRSLSTYVAPSWYTPLRYFKNFWNETANGTSPQRKAHKMFNQFDTDKIHSYKHIEMSSPARTNWTVSQT